MKKIKNYDEFIKESWNYSQEGKYVGIEVLSNGLELYLTTDGVKYIIEDTDLREDRFFDNYFEDIQVNSEWEYHPDLGSMGFGLTEAPGFTNGYYYNDDSVYTDRGHDDSKLYYYDNYMITNFLEVLKEKGKVFFHKHQ